MIQGNIALAPNYKFDDNILRYYPLTRKGLLELAGWVKDSIGFFRSNGEIKEKEGFELYKRERNLQTFIDDYSKKSSISKAEKAHKISAHAPGSSQAMGIPEPKLTPEPCEGCNCSGSISTIDTLLPSLSSFTEYPSLLAVRQNKPTLLIGYDSEWQNIYAGEDVIDRDMISWQFALIRNQNLPEYTFIKTGDKDLSLLDALACVLDHTGLYEPVDLRKILRYQYCAEWNDDTPVVCTVDDVQIARKKCKYVYRPEVGFTNELIHDMPDSFVARKYRDWAWFHRFYDFSLVNSIRICIVCHTGEVDLTALSQPQKNLLKFLTEVQGGLVTLQPVRYVLKSLKNVNNTHVYPISLSVSDTMCHAPAKKKKLKDLGEVIGVEKIDISKEQKGMMKDLLQKNPVLYMEYASTDSIVTLLYASAIYGYNNTLPVTITSASAKVMKETMMKYLKCESTEEFNRKYRGLEKVSHGKFKLKDRPGFVEATNLEPISNDANTIQYFASQSFHGGYNICTERGYFPYITFDYDLQNAYPTSMVLVPDINWEDPIRDEITRKYMNLGHFAGIGCINPIAPFVGYITEFHFPEHVKFPCIPINVEGNPCYPRSSDGLGGVYVAGPYIWLALKLGATVFCERGYFLNVLYTENYSQESRSLAAAVKQLVIDRKQAKLDNDKGSLEELILKTMVNAGFGKNAQNVIQKHTWSAYKDMMEDLGCSAITNPVSAMMITSIVQAELIAAQNQIHELGYMSCSVTTDGFISNCPFDTLKKLDLYGLRKFMESARLFLTDGEDSELWEIKHVQDDLVNFTTRGNVSLHDKNKNPMIWNGKEYPGVCAHNSTKSGFEPDSYEDRFWLMTKVLSCTGPVEYTESQWTSFKEYVKGGKYGIKKKPRRIHMDFDMKRKPIRDSFHTDYVVIDGVEYEIAHFDTEPFQNVAEYRLYRKKKELVDVLRTEADWDVFWLKLSLNATGTQIHIDEDWSILMSCIMGYRAERWDIPGLNGKSVEEKCDWINAHNTSKKKFKPSDWKNCRRPERQVNMMPFELIKDKLSELQNAPI